MKKFSFFVAAASGLLSLAVSPSQGQIRLLDDEQEQRRYERDRYSEPSDRDRYSDRYDGDGFASQYPAAEVQAVPMARARTAQARSELRQAENAVTAVLRNARLRFERSSEYQEALAEEKRAYENYLSQRHLALQTLRDEPRYVSAMELRDDLTKQIAEYREADKPDIQQVVSLAMMKLNFASVASEMEAEAIRANPRISEARTELAAAGEKTSQLRQQFADEVRENEDILAARQHLDDTRTELITAEAFLDSAIRARNLALRYAYYLHRDDRYRYSRYYDDYYDYDNYTGFRYPRHIRY